MKIKQKQKQKQKNLNLIMVNYYGKSGGRNFPEYFLVGVDTK